MNPFKQINFKRRKHTSNQFQEKEDTAKVINTRLKIIVVVVGLIFFSFFGRMVQLQLIDNESYQAKLAIYTAKKQTFSAPRGNIYDRNGKVLAQSIASLGIMYYPPETITPKGEWELAEKFVDDLQYKSSGITTYQLQEMLYMYEYTFNNNNFDSLWSVEEKAAYSAGDTAKRAELVRLKTSRIDLSKLDEHTKLVYEVKMKMGQAPQNQYKNVVEDASQEQLAYLTEHGSDFPGFKGSTSGWKRVYPYGDLTKAIVGSVSTQTQGIPAEMQTYYLGLGYALNDRVGISGIEKEYEQFLSGTKSIYSISYDGDGLAILSEEQMGKKGYDITLNIDVDFMKHMDDYLKGILQQTQSEDGRQYLDKLYFSAMDPNTGEVLAMNGVNRGEDGVLYSSPSGVYLDPDRVGSSVKIATLYMGQDQGVVYPGEVLVDEPMEIKGTALMQSYTNKGAINDLQAIEKSSNVYMWRIAIGLGGGTYEKGMQLAVKDGTFELMRTYYNMFGLGVETGIDVPTESVGYIGNTLERGKILNLAIGQYDTYTTLQLNQYASTIANGGYRLQPQLLKEVHEVNDLKTIVYQPQKNVLSFLKGDATLLERGQQGMRLCVSEGYCGVSLGDANTKTQMAAKTGTAENELYMDGTMVNTTNSTQIAYGPFEDPKIAFACSAPNADTRVGSDIGSNICTQIIGEASSYYFSK